MITIPDAAGVAARLRESAEALDDTTGEALHTQVAAMVAEAKRRCPVETGALRNSIAVHTPPRDTGITAVITADAPYARAVELGTRRAPPRAFLTPAARTRMPALLDSLAQAVRRAVNGGDQ